MPGKDYEGCCQAAVVPLASPSVGSSAHPASSLPSVWAFLLPALDHIMRTSQSTGKPGVISVEYHSLCHTYIYDWCTSAPSFGPENGGATTQSGGEIYARLDDYFADLARDVFRTLPTDNSLVHHLVVAYERYAAGAQSVHRLLNYLNRHFVRRAVEEDRGWLRMEDAFEGPVPAMTTPLGRAQLLQRMQDFRADELRKWGYRDGGPPENVTAAEARAEAASAHDRIVPLLSLAYRRFRVDVVDPLLAVPKQKGSRKRGSALTGKAVAPKSRLTRSVKALLESKAEDAEERRRVAASLAVYY
jgi:hypothetical protein